MNRYMPTILILVLVVLTLGLIFLYRGEVPSKPENVFVEVEEGKVQLKNGRGTVDLSAGERAAAEQGDVPVQIAVQPSPTPTVVPTPALPPEGVLAVRLVDALGDSIPNGIIEIASRTYESATSEFLIRDVSEGTYMIQARAEGYQSTTSTVQIPTEDWQAITLEYLCSFEIFVHSDLEQTLPVSGVELSLVEGPKPPRPPKSLLSVVAEKNALDRGILGLRPVGGKIRIDSIEGMQPNGSWVNDRFRDSAAEQPRVELNDVVVGMKTRSKEVHSPLSRLRQWDTIALASLGPD
ncbi:MAG TPA: hypothetical protein PK395_10375, partial [bacterium]|nr:hypothetical protein [bacterium]